MRVRHCHSNALVVVKEKLEALDVEGLRKASGGLRIWRI